MDECSSTLDHTFSALAHPTRRGMLELLAREPVRVTDLAAQFDCSLNVASKHILSLERAGLVRREQKGREHWLQLDATPLSQASDFMERYHKLWDRQLDRLGTYLDTIAGPQGALPSTKSKTLPPSKGSPKKSAS